MSYASYSSLGKDPKAPPPESMAKIPRITSRDHRHHFLQKYHIVVIDNYTDWCGPCKSVAPHYAKLAQRYQNMYPNQVVFVKENVEDNLPPHPDTPPVRGVPCSHFYMNQKNYREHTVTGGNIKSVQENLDKLLRSK